MATSGAGRALDRHPPNGAGLPPWPAFNNTDHRVLYLGDPIVSGGVANIDSLAVLDTAYSTVRGKPFAAP